ncbi:ribonuclease P protein component [Rhodoferax sp.]|uniref:ribonuclease P protein component n=1 Tax=Rhodoferax sp. TaxID=50421 RepID=UPI002ACDE323|nr:ribonuclease P protein component [Rhodoferax sp.]MDZ7921410.1 ribonuclease P protein component [Rhodoferax sp.]
MRRLKTRAQFQAVLGGMTVSKTAHFALHARALAAASDVSEALLFPEPAVWLGAMVPKRWAKRAVTRNTIKRQIYTLGAEFSAELGPHAHLVRLRSGFDRKQFPSATSEPLKAAVRSELQQLFARARTSVIGAKP